jgi:hypothetical protein
MDPSPSFKIIPYTTTYNDCLYSFIHITIIISVRTSHVPTYNTHLYFEKLN